MAGERFLLLVTTDGYGKRMPVSDIPPTKRGRAGVTVSPVPLAGAGVVTIADDVLIATRAGKVERIVAADVPVKGRRARGVRVLTLKPGDRVQRVVVCPRSPVGDATMQREAA